MSPVYKLSESSITGRTNYGSMLAGNTAYVIPGDYESIETVTVASTATTVSFTSIPSGYQHLQIRLITRNNRANTLDGLYVRFNSDSGNNYSDHFLRGSGEGVAANATTSTSLMFVGTVPATSSTASVFGVAVIDVLDYANTNKNKTLRSLLGYDANGTGFVGLFSGAWYSTAAITSITLGSTNGNGFLQNSSFALYGIKG